MKITKQRLIQIIKEELENTQIVKEIDKEEYKRLEKMYGPYYIRSDRGYEKVLPEGYKEMLKALEEIGRMDVISALSSLYELGGPQKMKQIHDLVNAKDMEGLDNMIGSSKAYASAVIGSGPLGT